tara:strand:+ start:1401 stop:1595 length:195 start_codon:yes stop_codon:yes gene_type:complete
MNKQVVYNIKVFNKVSKTTWEHRRVPEEHVEMLKMSPNLEVSVVKKFFMFSERNNVKSSKDSNM